MPTVTTQSFADAPISRILLRMAPPVMLAQLIQALYNIVDSLFVGRYGDTGLTALSIIYPLQLLMIALAVGTGVGVNTAMAAQLGVGHHRRARAVAGIATPLAAALWALFALVSWLILPTYAHLSTDSAQIADAVILYGRIVCLLSPGVFLESVWSKILQARGDMKTPMLAQIAGAVVNLVLDPLLIFGLLGLPELGIAGAAIATVAGQFVAALVVLRRAWAPSPPKILYPRYIHTIFRLGIPNILMQSAYTFYIFGLNLILSSFSDDAVTALGLYYKWMTFFFIPLGAMQTCMVPVLSYNHAAGNVVRCRETVSVAIRFGMALMLVGALCFLLIPEPMLRVFTDSDAVVFIGRAGFRIIGLAFLPMTTSLTYPVFFQAVGQGLRSSLLTVLRTVVLFVPLGFLFSRLGLCWFWVTFPVTEILTSLAGLHWYRQFLGRANLKGRRTATK